MFSCKSEVSKPLSLEEEILKDIDSHKFFKCENLSDKKSIQYVESVNEKIDFFLETLKKETDSPILLGSWTLKNSSNQQISERWSFYTSNFFDIEKRLYIEYLFLNNYSFIYTNGTDIYISPSVCSYLIKKIVLDGDKLYFYILKNDKWVLDPIHEGGKYFYTKDGYGTNKQNVQG